MFKVWEIGYPPPHTSTPTLVFSVSLSLSLSLISHIARRSPSPTSGAHHWCPSRATGSPISAWWALSRPTSTRSSSSRHRRTSSHSLKQASGSSPPPHTHTRARTHLPLPSLALPHAPILCPPSPLSLPPLAYHIVASVAAAARRSTAAVHRLWQPGGRQSEGAHGAGSGGHSDDG